MHWSVGKTARDTATLGLLNCKSPQQRRSIDYKDKIVFKPWGQEYLLYQNDRIAIWCMNINKEVSTSMHCHPNKKTAAICVSGRAVWLTLTDEFELNEGDSISVDSGVFHRIRCESSEGVELLELESPPIKDDLLRYHDEFHRENRGYEEPTEVVSGALLSRRYNFVFDDDVTGAENLVYGCLHNGPIFAQNGEEIFSFGSELPKLAHLTFALQRRG